MSTAITTYEWLLAPHILFAVIWVGGAAATQVFAFRAIATNDPQRVAAFSGDAEWIGMRVFLPSSLILVVFGFLLVAEGNWDYELWVIFGIVIWALSVLTGMLFLGPESGRIQKLTEEKGIASPDVQARIRRIFLISRIEFVLLVLVVLDMTLKPGA